MSLCEILNSKAAEIAISITTAFYKLEAVEQIALLALFATLYQAWISRQHNRLTTLPMLALDVEDGHDEAYCLKLTNKGLGPALIKSLSVKYGNEELPLTGTDDFEKMVKRKLSDINTPQRDADEAADHKYEYEVCAFSDDYPIQAGESLILIKATLKGWEEEYRNQVSSFLDTFSVVINYTTPYGSNRRLHLS